MTATLNGRMANVVGYFVPLHSLTTLVTHMYIFGCCLRPTSGIAFGIGFEPMEVLISLGRLTVCCLKPLGHPNIFAGTENYDISTPCLTGKRSASELRSNFFFCRKSESRTHHHLLVRQRSIADRRSS